MPTTENPLQMAHRRRAALREAGCSTYVVSHPDADYDSITCLCCGYRSYNQHDVDNRYCGYCHQFHEGYIGLQGS